MLVCCPPAEPDQPQCWLGQAAQRRAAAAEAAAAKHREEAERGRARVGEVEAEMRCLLAAAERQKRASAAKLAQLARAVHELQAPLQLPAWQVV